MAQHSTRRKRVLGSNVVYRTDSMMAALVAAGLRRWDNRWLCLPWLQRATCLVVAGLLLSQAQDGFSNPVGGNVVMGKATVTSSGGTVQIDQTTKIVIIDWSKFNIAKGETTQFLQPGTNALAVNRIGGNDPTQILGNLLANGRIILINGNGILFGPNAKVDVGALIATTSNASNEDIASGKATFDKAGNPNAMVVNQGSINAKTGMVGLVAPAVRNDGVIMARLSNVTLGASNIFTVDFTGDGLISFPLDANVVSKALDANGKPVEALVVNNGRIEGATVLLTARAAKDLVRNVISMGGTIAANKVTSEGGKVVLSVDSLFGGDTDLGTAPAAANTSSVVLDGGNGGVSVTGTIDVSGMRGGTIDIKGGRIELAGATLDASGTAGGGSIRIGGEAAQTISVDAASLLSTSAITNGDAGSIYVMSQATQFAGRAEAKGGAYGGNGGTIETSGHVLDIANASIDTSAVSGCAGNWLLDPDDYTIDTAQASTIQTNLASGNVTIQTTLAGSGGNGDIFVNAPVSWSNGNSLTLSAYRNVAVNANIVNAGGAAVSLRADNTGTGIGTVSFASGKTVSTSGAVSIFYNPSVNPVGSVVNTTSYVSRTENFALNMTGGGTLTASMLVNSVYDLQNIQNNLSGTYALGRDIDASATATWNGGAGFRPIGYSSASTTNNYWGAPFDGLLVGVNANPAQFIGTLDGQGRTIIDLVINDTGAHNLGLFSWIGPSGAVRGLGLVGGSLTAGGQYSNFGMLAGWNSGAIDSVYSTTPVRSIGSGSYLNMGGLVGFNWGGTIANSYATGNVTGGGGGSNVGGLVGMNGLFGLTSKIVNSYATGDVSNGGGMGGLVGGNDSVISGSYATGTVTGAPGAGNLGGLVGYSNGYWGGDHITSSYATGNVTGDSNSQDVGGLIGSNSWNATLTNSYATGNVTGGSAVGGLVGWNGYSNLNQPIPAMISGSWSSSRVSGDNFVGSLVGFNNNGFITQSYWDNGISGAIGGLGGSNGGSFAATGLTSAQARTQLSYVGWDFAGTWFMIDGETRPFLRSEYSTTITNAHQLQLMAMNLSATYTLANDIDLGPALAADANGNYSGMWGASGFVPIGYSSASTTNNTVPTYDGIVGVNATPAQFVGTFDGLGHTISNLVINRTETFNLGLFSWISSEGEVRNVGLRGGGVKGGGSDQNVGQLAGWNVGSINNVYTTGSVSLGDTAWNVGGLVGWNWGGTISNSYATGSVTVGDHAGDIGGLVGWMGFHLSNGGTIDGSYATGNVTAGSSSSGIGGLIGGNNGGHIRNSYANGDVSGGVSSSLVGGLVGGNSGYWGGGQITASYATGNVNGGSGSTWVGGLVGMNAWWASIAYSYSTGDVAGGTDVGGLVGFNGIIYSEPIGSTINTSYASGQVSGSSYVGGLVGYNHSGDISQSYWDQAINGSISGLGGNNGGSFDATGLTATQARTQSSYTGWDFAGTWFMIDGETRPFLRSEYSTTITNAHQLQLMAMNLSAHYTLANDIGLGPALAADANGNYSGMWGASGFVPIGDWNHVSLDSGFVGSLDGNGHTISNLTIFRPTRSYTGLFGYIGTGARVHGVGLLGGSVTGYNFVGELTGVNIGTIDQSYTTGVVNGNAYVGGLAGQNFCGSGQSLCGLITQSHTTGTVSADVPGTVDHGDFVGGLVGYNYYGTITQSYAAGTVNGHNKVGGLVGYNYSSTVTQSYATGTVSGGSEVGGLVGHNEKGTIVQTYATGAVSDTNQGGVGGLVGLNAGTILQSYASGAVAGPVTTDVHFHALAGGLVGDNEGTITQSYATGTVSGSVTIGGLAGVNSGTIIQSYANGSVNGFYEVGGLVGVSSGPVTQSYATGPVIGSIYVGGFIGIAYGADLNTQSYWDMQSTGQVNATGYIDPGGITGLTTGQLTNGSLPGGFDHTIWGAKSGSYPCLLWQAGCTAAPVQPSTSITYSVADAWSTYGTLATLGAVTLTGVAAADQANVSGVLGLFDTSSSAVSLSDSLNAGTYAVKVTSLAGSAAPNYTIAATGNHDGTLTINPAPLIVAVNNASRIYGDANPAFTANITGFVLGQNAGVLSDLYLLTSATNESGVGTYGISAAGVSGNYYIASATDGTLTVTQRPITITANIANRLYGDANPNLTYSVTTGMLVNDDTLSGALATLAGLTSNVGDYAITQGTVTASSNYAVTFQPGTLNVLQRSITVVADSLSRIYGDANPSLTYAITSGNLVNGDALNGALATSAVLALGIGNYAIEQGTLAASSNYAISFQAGTLTITPRPVSVAADNSSRLYGDSNPPLTYSVTSGNLVNGDAFSGYLTTAAGVTSNVGGYAIGQGTLGLSSNYALSFTPGTLTINQAPVTIAVDNISRAYGDANPARTATITGLKLGQDASVLSGLTYATTATQLSGVGGYAITSSGGTSANYYIADRTDGTLTVIARAITVTADTLSRVYGGQNPALTYAVTSGNLVNGDLLSGALTTTATALSNVDSYVIGQGTLAASSNYALTFQPGALVIVPRMITVAADNLSRLYGDPNGALTYTITSGNLVNGDALTGALATTAVQASDVGSYVISQGTLAAPLNNYALSFTSGTLTINPAQLSVAVNDAARLYGDANPQFSAVITGFKLGQDSSVLSGLAFSTTATQTSNVGSYTVTSSGGTAMNYTITGRTNGTLTVTARPITVAANNLSRVYGGANPTLTYSVTSGGLVNGDRLSGALATSAVAASNVGNYAITQGSLAASSNYTLSFAPGTLTVFARPITVIANNATRIYGEANPSLTYAITSGNLVNGDTLAGALSTSAVLTSNVGNYSIARGSLTAGSNYSLNFQPGTLTITARAITVAADNKSRTYGDANPGLTYAVTSGSLVNGDGITGALSTSAVLTSAVANYAINLGTLTAGSNYTMSFQSGTLAVTQRAITVTANNTSRSYGDTNSLTYSITTGTLVNGDTLTGSLTTSAVQTSTVGTYAISQGTLTASSNYTVAFHGGTLTITPAALAVAVNNASRMYGYANPDFTAAITGFKNGEDASVVSGLVFLTDAARTSSVGTYAIKSSGGTAANYVIVTRTDGTLTVEPLPAATTEQMNGVGTYLGNLPANQNDQNLPLCTNTEVIAVANDNGGSQVVLGAPQCR